MTPLNKFIFIAVLNFFFLITNGQSLTGVWVGNYAKINISNNPTSLVVEINVTNDSVISGLSHLYYHNSKYEHHKIAGKINLKNSSCSCFGGFEIFV